MAPRGGGEVVIDGSHGEGGGQILRSSLAVSAITGCPLVIERIRAKRRNPGLAAQHLTAVRSAAALCAAHVEGATIGSATLDFRPTVAPRAGSYVFDVAEAREGGSAGATSLVLHTVAVPAFFADGEVAFRIRGGTHVAWSPPYDYLTGVWQPFLTRIGLPVETELLSFGFYPQGGGEIVARVQGQGRGAGDRLKPVTIIERGALRAIRGRALAANLPAQIPQRMMERARGLLANAAPEVDIHAELVGATGRGAGIFLTAEYDNIACGFSALGAIGKRAEAVAEEAVGALLAHEQRAGALDRHLADQALLPLAFASAPSRYSSEEATEHLRTEAWVIAQFGVAEIGLEERRDGSALITVLPAGESHTYSHGRGTPTRRASAASR